MIRLMTQIVLVCMVFIFCSTVVQGQQEVKIVLQSGKVYKGNLLSIDSVNNHIYIQTKKQLRLGIPQELIKNYTDKTEILDSESNLGRILDDLEIGGQVIYNTNTVGSKESKLDGVSGEVMVSYPIIPRWTVGLISGMDSYHADNNEYMIPLLVSSTVYLRPYSMSPFVRLSGGYSFGIEFKNGNLLNHKGGSSYRSMVGLRLPEWQGLTTELALGVHWQQNKFTTVRGNEISNFDLMYRRLVFSLGLHF